MDGEFINSAGADAASTKIGRCSNVRGRGNLSGRQFVVTSLSVAVLVKSPRSCGRGGGVVRDKSPYLPGDSCIFAVRILGSKLLLLVS